MCGIFGVSLGSDAKVSFADLKALLESLFHYSESRGKESAGVFVYLPATGQSFTVKSPKRATELIRSGSYRSLLDDHVRHAVESAPRQPVTILAHSRLVTNGAAERDRNNQPVNVDGVTVIHNGIIVNVDELWAQHAHLSRSAEVDTEIMAARLADEARAGASFVSASAAVFGEIRGAASIAWVHDCGDKLALATNTGDLYTSTAKGGEAVVFASERYILTEALRKADERDGGAVQWVPPGEGRLVDLNDLSMTTFSLVEPVPANDPVTRLAPTRPGRHHAASVASGDGDGATAPRLGGSADYSLLRYGEAAIRGLRRCSRCVLPETFPFICFDADGVCNYCNGYKSRYKGLDPDTAKRDFIQSLEKYRRSGGEPDVLVAFSGGRDSSYGLHLIKKEFGLEPITFTYDWGMVTDLARRNIARICGQLGVQNILVSADIRAKRENIRKNVSAWLKKPDLGMIPLFMAGDKHFFSVVNRLKRQTGIDLDLWSANPLENTDFKSGFCGIEPDFDKSRVDYLSLKRKFQMLAYYGTRFAQNPRYINRSMLDTAGAFFAYYIEPRRNFFFIFDHMVWEENEVNRVLLSEYDWELAKDTKSTWRIGDGTAPFYNYIYMTSSGFSEFDTFRSNQIREGMMTREAALESIFVENRPRADSIKWYLDTIGLPFDDTIRVINKLDHRGLHA